MLSGLPVLALLAASLAANAAQLYFSSRSSVERHARAALWARALDWAAAAGAATGFAAYASVVAAAPRLVRALSGVQVAVVAGTTASNLFAAVVGTTLAGAVINTFLTAGDAGFDAYVATKRRGEGAEKEEESSGSVGVSFRRRPAYEPFP